MGWGRKDEEEGERGNKSCNEVKTELFFFYFSGWGMLLPISYVLFLRLDCLLLSLSGAC
jgi:hypothetical protein